MIYAQHKLSDYSKYYIKKIAELAMMYCYENLGKKLNSDYPTLKITYNKNCFDYGEYDFINNEIVINVLCCKTISDLTSTIIHEYTHSKQNILEDYTRIYRKVGYHKHPMEIEAYNAEKLYNRKCLNYIRKYI